jgi:hypothetical protein
VKLKIPELVRPACAHAGVGVGKNTGTIKPNIYKTRETKTFSLLVVGFLCDALRNNPFYI